MARVAAPEGLVKLSQRDFSAGAFPGDGVSVDVSVGQDRIPPNGCADIVNGLIDEDGSIYRRGGSVYLGTFAANPTADRPFYSLWSGYLGTVGQVVVASRLEGTPIFSQRFWTMGPGDTDFSFRWSDLPTIGPQRPVVYDGMVVFVGAPSPSSGPGAWIAAWGGATAAEVTGQSVTLTEGSKTVTGAGTAFLSAAAGMMLNSAANLGERALPIESVQSNTSLTLLAPWPDATVTLTVDISSVVSRNIMSNPLPAGYDQTYAAVIADRMVVARGNRIAFTFPGDPFKSVATDYHELPYGAIVTGLEPIRDQLLVFSTGGLFVISNLAYDLTDAMGNVQQRLERVAPDTVLWDNLGIAGWQGSVVAPCTDDVYLIDSGATSRPIGGGMRTLYRSYVKQGFQTGQAAVFNGRYLLPILQPPSGTRTPTWVDTLVCDLRTGAWTRWGDYGGEVRAFATKVSDQTRQPRVLSLGLRGANPRVQDISGAFTPAAAVKNDADGSTHQLRVRTRPFDLGDLIEHTWRKVRVRMELEDAASDDPYMDAYSEHGRLTLSDSYLVDHVGEGESIYTWPVRERARAVRFVLSQYSAAARARIRAIDVFVRRSEKL